MNRQFEPRQAASQRKVWAGCYSFETKSSKQPQAISFALPQSSLINPLINSPIISLIIVSVLGLLLVLSPLGL